MVRAAAAPVALAVVATACETTDTLAPFLPDVSYTDTLALVGTADEENPLFLYARIGLVSLLDDSTVVFTDQEPGGRLVIANMISGEGWEIASPTGGGPGEFDGHNPWTYPSQGVVQTITAGGRYSARTKAGELVADRRFTPDSVFGPYSSVSGFPQGFVGERLVIHVQDAVRWDDPSPQEIRQAIRIYDMDTGRVIDIHDGMPSHVEEVVRNRDGSLGTRHVTERKGATVAARHDLIAHGVMGSHVVTVRDQEGRVTAQRDIGLPIFQIRIDGNGRIWIQVDVESPVPGPRWVVLDRDLNELFRTVVRMQDAHDDVVLTLVRNRELDLLSLALVGRDSTGVALRRARRRRVRR